MEYTTLSENQKNFLKKYGMKYPFSNLDITIPLVLQNGKYDEVDANRLNVAIDQWKKMNKK